MPGSKQPVAAALDVLQHPAVGAKGLADCRNVNLEGVFFDDRTRPDAFHELIGGHQLAGFPHEDLDDLERTAADLNRNPAHAQLLPRRVDLHLAGLVDQR